MGDAERGKFLAFVPGGEAGDGAGAFVFPDALADLEGLGIGEADFRGGKMQRGKEQESDGSSGFH